MFKTPPRPSNEIIIWRYIGLDKFIDLLINETITFTLVSIASDKNEISWVLKTLQESKKDPTGAINHIKN